jgi:putative cell wall-binding protein
MKVMRRSLMLVLVVALAVLVFAPAAFAQDDNPTGDDATSTATAGAGRDDDAAASVGGSLPDTGGMSLLSGAAGVLFLVGSGITAAMLLRRTP